MATVQDDVVEVVARMEFDGVEDVVNVYQFRLDSVSSVDEADVVDDMLDIMEALYTILKAMLPVIQVFRDIRVRNVTQGLLYGVHAWPTLTVGTGTGGPLPPGVGGLVSFPTNVSRVTMRKYWGGTTQDYLDGSGLLIAAGVTILTNAAAELIALHVEANGDWVYGYTSPKTLSFKEPVGALVTDIIAYQRRRKQGRGS